MTVYHVLLGEKSIGEVRQRAATAGYDVLPANRELAGAEIELVDIEHRETRLKEALQEIVADYDLKGTGYGVLIIIEALEKRNNRMYAWAAFLDKANNKVIASRRYIAEFDKLGKLNMGQFEGLKTRWMNVIRKNIKESGRTLKGYE